MSEGTLKPCPFCGGEADEHRDPGPTGELYVWVGCNDCDATSACVDERSMQPEESDAQSLWNTRAEASSAEPVAYRYGFDGYGWQYIDNGSGSDWTTRHPDAEPLYAHSPSADLAGYERGQRETVARIVDWLLRQVIAIERLHDEATMDEQRKPLKIMAKARFLCATAIEAGEWK